MHAALNKVSSIRTTIIQTHDTTKVLGGAAGCDRHSCNSCKSPIQIHITFNRAKWTFNCTLIKYVYTCGHLACEESQPSYRGNIPSKEIISASRRHHPVYAKGQHARTHRQSLYCG